MFMTLCSVDTSVQQPPVAITVLDVLLWPVHHVLRFFAVFFALVATWPEG